VLRTEFGELPCSLLYLSRIRVNCESNSRVLLGVCDCQGVLLVGSGGDGVRSFTLRVDMTRSGLKGTSLAPWNPP
jgi:hypothetical protein